MQSHKLKKKKKLKITELMKNRNTNVLIPAQKQNEILVIFQIISTIPV